MSLLIRCNFQNHLIFRAIRSAASGHPRTSPGRWTRTPRSPCRSRSPSSAAPSPGSPPSHRTSPRPGPRGGRPRHWRTFNIVIRGGWYTITGVPSLGPAVAPLGAVGSISRTVGVPSTLAFASTLTNALQPAVTAAQLQRDPPEDTRCRHQAYISHTPLLVYPTPAPGKLRGVLCGQ